MSMNNSRLSFQWVATNRLLWLFCFLVGLSSSALAQGNRVCLYDRPNFGGQSVCVNAGESIDDLQRLAGPDPGGWRDRVASIRLVGRAQVTIYEDVGFAGGSYRVEVDIPNLARLRDNELRGWRRQVSSIKVERSGFPDQAGPGQDNRVCLYAQPNFGGRAICFNVGDDTADLRRAGGGWSDRVASIRLFGNVQATIYEDIGFGGASYVIASDIPEVARLRNNELRNWQREMSSIRVDRRRGGGQSLPDGPERGDRVCLYDQPNFGGQSVCFRSGESSSELRLTGDGWNDRAVSIRIFGSVQATIYEHVGFGGASFVVSTDITNLAQIRLAETRGNFRQQISAISVDRSRDAANPNQTLSEAFRLGQQDHGQGRLQDYRNHRGRYDRQTEVEFEREYNRGYDEASGNRGGDTSAGAFRSLSGAYSGLGQLQIGNRTQRVTDLLVRLRPGGSARFEVSGEGQPLSLGGSWTEGNRGQIELTISQGFGNSGATGRGRMYTRNNIFQRIELTGQTNRQSFSLNFRDDDAGWGGGGWTPGGGRPGEAPTGALIHRGGIINRGSGKALDVTDLSTADGASIQQWDFARQPNQTWQVIDVGNGEVAIIADHSSKVLTVQGGRDLNGASVVQREWRNNPYQRWRLERVSGDLYRIVNVGSRKCLDVRDQSRVNGGNVQQWDYANQRNQQWKLER